MLSQFKYFILWFSLKYTLYAILDSFQAIFISLNRNIFIWLIVICLFILIFVLSFSLCTHISSVNWSLSLLSSSLTSFWNDSIYVLKSLIFYFDLVTNILLSLQILFSRKLLSNIFFSTMLNTKATSKSDKYADSYPPIVKPGSSSSLRGELIAKMTWSIYHLSSIIELLNA